MLAGTWTLSACVGTAPSEVDPVASSAVAAGVVPGSPAAAVTPAPEPPAAMAVGDGAGAVAAADHLFALWTHARTTGSVAALTGTYADTCGICRDVTDRVVELAAIGVTEADGDLDLLDPTPTEIVPGSWFAVTGVLVEGSARLVDAEGVTTGTVDSGRYGVLMTLTWYEGVWRVESLDLEPATT